jgi:hypothetical protein
MGDSDPVLSRARLPGGLAGLAVAAASANMGVGGRGQPGPATDKHRSGPGWVGVSFGGMRPCTATYAGSSGPLTVLQLMHAVLRPATNTDQRPVINIYTKYII